MSWRRVLWILGAFLSLVCSGALSKGDASAESANSCLKRASVDFVVLVETVTEEDGSIPTHVRQGLAEFVRLTGSNHAQYVDPRFAILVSGADQHNHLHLQVVQDFTPDVKQTRSSIMNMHRRLPEGLSPASSISNPAGILKAIRSILRYTTPEDLLSKSLDEDDDADSDPLVSLSWSRDTGASSESKCSIPSKALATHLIVASIPTPEPDPDLVMGAPLRTEKQKTMSEKRQKRNEARNKLRIADTLEAFEAHATADGMRKSVSLSLFIDSWLHKATELLGMPEADALKRDYSSMSPEELLRLYPVAGVEPSDNAEEKPELRRALLQAGFPAHIYHTHDIVAAAPRMFAPPGAVPYHIFKDIQDLYCSCWREADTTAADDTGSCAADFESAKESRLCPEGHTCHPSFGCVMHEEDWSANQSSSDPFIRSDTPSESDLDAMRKLDELYLPHDGPGETAADVDKEMQVEEREEKKTWKAAQLHASFTDNKLRPREVESLDLTMDHFPLMPQVVRLKRPVILRDAVRGFWKALDRWDTSYLKEFFPEDTMEAVKRANKTSWNHKFYDLDPHSSWSELEEVNGTIHTVSPFEVLDIQKETFFDLLRSNQSHPYKYYYFGSLPEALQQDVSPSFPLYISEQDAERKMQYLWMSSPGVALHTHFDQDHNMFAQLVGRKRFVLFAPTDSNNLYPFPRTHPLWHKSQADFHRPDLQRFPSYAHATAYEAVLNPGDILYVPPYWWHRVEALTTSVSLSTWSEKEGVAGNMNFVHEHEHKFDTLVHPKGKVFALRLYLDSLVEAVFGQKQTSNFFHRLLRTRYSDPPVAMTSVGPLCLPPPSVIPTARHVFADLTLDVSLVREKFMQLEPDARDILFGDFCDQLVASLLGLQNTFSFFRSCFLGQRYDIMDREPGNADGSSQGEYLWEMETDPEPEEPEESY